MTTTRPPSPSSQAPPSRAPAEVVSRYCRPLGELNSADLAVAGAKAASLGTLRQAGFPVPEGFVISARALSETVSPEGTEHAVRTRNLPEGLREEIAEALAALGEGPVAVRSSGVAEDGSQASFAGQYVTVLGVSGLDEVIDAVRECWASAFAKHLTAYGEKMEQEGLQRLAVLIQKQLHPRCAGVAFSADPVTGERGKVVINSVRGLAERLVSGQASPDIWTVREQQAVCESSPEDSLESPDAVAIAALAERIAAHLEAPQDIEWAIEGETLSLLQARPITALGKPRLEPKAVPVEVPHGFWERNDTYYPHPLSPMFRSFFLDGLNRAYRRFFAECGALAVGGESREIGGWVYMRLVPLGGRDMPIPPDWITKIAFRLVPMFRRRIKTSVEAIRNDRFGSYIDRWEQTWRAEMTRRSAEALALDKAALSEPELAHHVEDMEAFVREALEIHFLVIGAHFFPMAEFAFTCKELLGWDEGRCLPLLAGLSKKSTEPARALEELATAVRQRPRLRELLESGASAATLLAEDTDLRDAFEAYQQSYGHRVLRYEISEPTVAEQPELVLSWLRDQLERDYDGSSVKAKLANQRQATLAEVEAQLGRRPKTEQERFSRALERAQRAYPIREDNEFSTLSAPLAVARYAARELGKRLAAKDVLEQPDDVFWLELQEALAALADGENRQPLVTERQAEHAWVAAHPGPRSYGKPPHIPDSAPGLPPEADFVFRAGLWMRDHGFAPAESQRQQTDPTRIEGIAAAAGSFTGPVRVVCNEAEFSKLRPGDVLVCPITSPVWSVLFASIGALVTDTGGLLSHSAIIAREYGIPAVVATGNATRLLRDGQRVTVDGDAGLVRSTGA